jgi:spermidine/putrescine-binding protein
MTRRHVRNALTRRQAIGAGVSGAAAVYLAGCGGTSSGGSEKSSGSGAASLAGKPVEDRMIMANWSDYSDPANYKAFTKEFGAKITVEGFGSNDELIAKMSAGGTAYDMVSPSGGPVKEIVEKGLAMELDHELIPNLKNLKPAFQNTEFDKGNKYSVCKDYGITSFFYRTDVVKDPPDTLKGWFELLPTLKGKNINLIEGASETIPLAMVATGKDPNSENEEDYAEAMELLMAAKPAITTINSTFIERLQRGQIDLGIGWNGDVLRAKLEGKKKGIPIEFFVDPNAGIYWTDNWLVPAASKSPVAAHKWIDFILRPDVAGKEWNYHGYPVPVIGAETGVKAEIGKDPMVDIPDEVLSKYKTTLSSPKLNEIQAKFYTQLKSS